MNELAPPAPIRKVPGLCGPFDGDSESECFKLPYVTTHGALGMAAVEVVRPEFPVVDAVAHDVERNLEDLVADRDNSLLVSGVSFDSAILSLQRRTILPRGR
jgi:hypothetical protein